MVRPLQYSLKLGHAALGIKSNRSYASVVKGKAHKRVLGERVKSRTFTSKNPVQKSDDDEHKLAMVGGQEAVKAHALRVRTDKNVVQPKERHTLHTLLTNVSPQIRTQVSFTYTKVSQSMILVLCLCRISCFQAELKLVTSTVKI